MGLHYIRWRFGNDSQGRLPTIPESFPWTVGGLRYCRSLNKDQDCGPRSTMVQGTSNRQQDDIGNCFGPYSRSIRNMYLKQILTNGRPYHSAISQAGFQVTMGRVKIVLFALVSSDPFTLVFSKGQPSKLLG